MRAIWTECLVGVLVTVEICRADPPVPKPAILSEPPRISAHALTIPQEDDSKISNWNAALTCAHLSKLAYLPMDESEVEIKKLGFQRVDSIAVENSHAKVCSTDEVVVVAFRGTEVTSIADWLSDLDIASTPYDSPGYIHHGFYKATLFVYEPVRQAVLSQGGEKKKICVTGHSLGGAMAAVFSLWAMKSQQLKIFSVTTFGQPLPMDRTLAMYMNDTFKGQYRRFVNGADVVTHVLPLAYWHSGGRVHMHSTLDIFPPDLSRYRATASSAIENPREAMSIEEFQNLQAQLQSQKYPQDAMTLCFKPKRFRKLVKKGRICHCEDQNRVYAAWLPAFLNDHFMQGYIDQILKFGIRKID